MTSLSRMMDRFLVIAIAYAVLVTQWHISTIFSRSTTAFF
jgi:hypothetical protein